MPSGTVTSVLAAEAGSDDGGGPKSGSVPVSVPVLTVPAYRPFTGVVRVPFQPVRAVTVTDPVVPVPVTELGTTIGTERRATALRTLCPSLSLSVTEPYDQVSWTASVRVKVTLYVAEPPGATTSFFGETTAL